MDTPSSYPILATRVGKKPLVYLDNAATTQKPLCVVECERQYYEKINSNIHRGAHYLSRLATDEHEKARAEVRIPPIGVFQCSVYQNVSIL